MTYVEELKLGEELYALAADHAAWSRATFGADTERGPLGPLKHLEKEAREAQASPTDREEYADCLLLLLDASRRAGIGVLEMVRAAQAKMTKNKSRVWSKPAAPDRPVEHVRDLPYVVTIEQDLIPSDEVWFFADPPGLRRNQDLGVNHAALMAEREESSRRMETEVARIREHIVTGKPLTVPADLDPSMAAAGLVIELTEKYGRDVFLTVGSGKDELIVFLEKKPRTGMAAIPKEYAGFPVRVVVHGPVKPAVT